MAADPSPHLPDEALWRYGQGQLDLAEAERTSQHVDDCAECRQRLARMTATSCDAEPPPTYATEDSGLGRTTPAGMTCTEPGADSALPVAPHGHGLELAQHPDYEIIRELGRGGMGVVYLAHNKLLGRNEVLKVLDKSVVERSSTNDRFLREMRAVARLRHPNIVAAYSAFRSGDNLVFSMEHVDGLDLARMVRATEPIPVDRACYCVYQAALGLQHAHEEGMVHRDIKPGNLMLSHHKGRAVIKVLDFGLAKANCELMAMDLQRADVNRAERPGEELTLAGQMLGTPGYIAPEQIDDAQKADIRADIYSLGCTLYYLLSGHPPFERPSVLAVVVAHRFSIATPLDVVRPEIPAELAAVVAKMLEKEPDRRFQTPAEVALALAPFFKKRAETAASVGAIPATLTHDLGVDSTATSSHAAAAQSTALSARAADPARDGARPAANWETLIELDESDADSAGALDKAKPSAQRPAWLQAVLVSAAGIAFVFLAVALVVTASPRDRMGVGLDAHAEPESHGPSGPPADGTAGDRTSAAPATEVTTADATPDGDARPATAGLKPMPESGNNSDGASNAASTAQRARQPVLASTARPGRPEPSVAVGSDRAAEQKKPVATPLPPFKKARRWDWVHDLSLPAFDRWVERERARGYRPVFVSGHDLSSRPRAKKKAPDVAGDVRIAAIADRDERRLLFVVGLDEEKNALAHYREHVARGYQLSTMTTFTNGTLPFVLGIYTEGKRGMGFWMLGSTRFPEPHAGEWLSKGLRPVEVAGRPAGDFWRVTLGTINSKGVEWKAHAELSLAELRKVLVAAKGNGFRPESLFVCPGRARGGFGVVLTHDDPSLLWEVHADLTSAQLESDLPRMAEKGYAPDQLVGYAWAGVSHYMVCWTRSPDRYPATGLTDFPLEPLDLVLEQLLVEQHIPSATMAVFRSGRLALARGYGHADQKTGEPISPTASMSLGELSLPLAAAAVHSLIRKEKVKENAPLADLLGMPKDDVGTKPRAEAPGSEPTLTLGKLLGSLDPSAAKFDESERKALIALVGRLKPAATDQTVLSDLELQGMLLGRVIEAATAKPAGEVIASELAYTLRVARASPGAKTAEVTAGLDPLVAPATEVGRVFANHTFDGRPLLTRVKSKPAVLIRRQGSSLAVILRRDDLLAAVMVTLPQDAPPELGDNLRAALDRAVDSLSALPPAPAKRKSSPR